MIQSKEYFKQWREDNKEHLKAYHKEYRKKNPKIMMRRARKYFYKLTEEDFNALKTKQDNKCAICAIEFSDSVSPYVDHDHSCCPNQKSCGNCIRGLLCNRCNKAIGSFEDNPVLLQKAIDYLNREI